MKFQPFVDFYGLRFRSAKPVDVVLKYSAVESGAFDVMVVYATDGLNKRAGLTILEDDLGFFPEYYGAFLVREDLFSDFYDAAPNLEQVLELLTGQVSSEDMAKALHGGPGDDLILLPAQKAEKPPPAGDHQSPVESKHRFKIPIRPAQRPQTPAPCTAPRRAGGCPTPDWRSSAPLSWGWAATRARTWPVSRSTSMSPT